ncbi:MAG: sulfatase [Planctomycetota bacterium]|jgi:arylsulfatase A-like enzyme
MNIILVIIDTLRYDHVGAHGSERVRTPNLDALADRSWVFDWAFANSFPTIPHRTDVITGAYGRPFHPWAPLPHARRTFPMMLAENGYCTQLIHDTPHLVNGGHNFDWPFQAWTFIRGGEVDRPWIDDKPLTYLDNWGRDPLFDYIGDPDCKNVREHVLVSYTRANRHRQGPDDWNAARLFSTAAAFCRENARRDNFFLWVDSFDPHEPWDAPPEFVRMYVDEPGFDGRIDPRAFLPEARNPTKAPDPDAVRTRLKDLYAAKVSWMDHCLGKLTAALDEGGLWDRTAVILTSDHGTNVGDRGRFGKTAPVHDSEARVPMMVCVPQAGSGRCEAIVQPQDIMATVLNLAGLKTPDDVESHDLLSIARSGADPRKVALAGSAAHGWGRREDMRLFTVFDREGYLIWSPKLDRSELYAYGEDQPEENPDPAEVDHLWAAGKDELARRGAPDQLCEWLEGEAKWDFPLEALGPAGPEGYFTYWNKYYNKWE